MEKNRNYPENVQQPEKQERNIKPSVFRRISHQRVMYSPLEQQRLERIAKIRPVLAPALRDEMADIKVVRQPVGMQEMRVRATV